MAPETKANSTGKDTYDEQVLYCHIRLLPLPSSKNKCNTASEDFDACLAFLAFSTVLCEYSFYFISTHGSTYDDLGHSNYVGCNLLRTWLNIN